MIYHILHDIEKHVPKDMVETKSKILMPTYRFVTSANFALDVIVVALILIMILLPIAFAYEQSVVDKNGIKNIAVQDLNQDSGVVTFDYCHNKYSRESIGALVTSDLDVIPLPINSDSIKYGKCATYGTQILLDSESVNVTLFQHNGIDNLISSFNAKVHDLKSSLTQIEQKINRYEKLGYDDIIHQLEEKAKLLELQIKSAQSGLKTLIGMKSS
ncbi:MAG: hypothetical protein OEM28_07540 [Nitrosopumilus sp.]|nr:hypothetical protein [Nitrosopumilus sp.]MDH3488114.1 hypothetical protein [Nitrosopumilus sp.]